MIRVHEQELTVECPRFSDSCTRESCPACVVLTLRSEVDKIEGVPTYRTHKIPVYCSEFGVQLCAIEITQEDA